MTERRIVFGIDLGTTNSSISYFTEDGLFEVMTIDGHKSVPSIVAFKDKQFYVGRKALLLSQEYPSAAVFSIKRFMGDKDYKVTLDGESFSPVELSSKILSYLKLEGEQILGEKIVDVVITVPAYFGDFQRKDTLMAAKLAGLNILRIINEPTAAALAYDYSSSSSLSQNLDQSHKKSEKWIVYDWGGGTLDISILKVKGSYKEVLTSLGDNYLGGDDLDYKISEWIISQLGQDEVKKEAKSFFKILAEKAKMELTFSEETFIRVGDRNLIFSRDLLDTLIEEYVDKTLSIAKKSLKSAKLEVSQIDKLLFVGGSTLIPSVKAKVEAFFARKGALSIDPNYSVALGAALQAAICQGLEFKHMVVDVAPYTLGIAAYGEYDGEHNDMAHELWKKMTDESASSCFEELEQKFIEEYCRKPPRTFVPVIEKNTKLPVHIVKTFYTTKQGQRYIPIAIFQGESLCNDNNGQLGTFLVEIKPLPAHTPINVGMRYDLNGMVKLALFHENEEEEFASFGLHLNSTDSFIEEDKKAFAPNALNQLIVQVESQLKKQNDIGDEKNQNVKKLLNEYMGALKKGDDHRADDIEGQLGLWLDQN